MGSSDAPRLPMEQHWLCPPPEAANASAGGEYRPALLWECQLKFHHLRAQIKHTVERRYTAWYPRGQSFVDWDVPALPDNLACQIAMGPTLDLPHRTDGYLFSADTFREYLDDLRNRLVRKEKLTVYHNDYFDEFSEPDESREAFIARLAERAPESIESDLAQLLRRVNMKLSQVREGQERRGRKLEIGDTFLNNILMERRHELFASQARLEALFSSGERLLVTSSEGIPSLPIDDPEYVELQETLQLIEDETKRELNDLCTQCLQRATQCDSFSIGLQPNQIHVLRKGVLWVPVCP